MRMVPKTWIVKLQPGKVSLFMFMKSIFEYTAHSTSGKAGSKKGTIFEKLTDPSLPSEERTFARVRQETGVILQAGTESISRALTVAAFHLANQPAMRDTLREELRSALPAVDSVATWSQLEELPYLTGVVWECLRLSYGLVVRLPRCAPYEALRYNDYVIPPGTPVSMSSYLVHHDETVFPDSFSFHPERWIEAQGKSNPLNKYMVSFTRGSRACLGMNLSYLVLYMTIAAFVRRFDMELYHTSIEDLEIIRDYGLGVTRNGDVEVAVTLTKVLKE